MRSGTDTPARWPADGSCPQSFQDQVQRSGIHSDADAQPFAGRQYQFQSSFSRRLLPCRSSIHQSETYRLFLLEPFPPGVEGIFCQPLVLAELLHGGSAALLRDDSFGPLLGLGNRRSLLDGGHDTTMQRLPARREEGLVGRLRFADRVAEAASAKWVGTGCQ